MRSGMDGSVRVVMIECSKPAIEVMNSFKDVGVGIVIDEHIMSRKISEE